jgi:hypothetical protein
MLVYGTAGVINPLGSPLLRRSLLSAKRGERIPATGVNAMLNPEQRQEVIDWYALHVKACPLCECGEYLIESVVGMPEILPTGLSEAGGYVGVPVVCKSCGYTIFVSATALKFFRPVNPPARLR